MKIEKKAELIKQDIQGSIEGGFFAFESGPYTNSRISLPKLYKAKHRKDLLDLCAGVILEQPTSGVIGFCHERHMKWVEMLGNALKRQGAHEVPYSELWRGTSNAIRGLPLDKYYPNTSVTVFSIVHTLGEEIEAVRRIVERKGLKVSRAVSLINRNPNPITEVSGIPFSSVLHIPMPLYDDIFEAKAKANAPSRSMFGVYDMYKKLEGLLG